MKGTRLAILCVLAGAAMVLASCSTTSRLQAYHLYGSALSAQLLVPPEPTMDVHYSVTLDASNPVVSALSVGSNLAKASQATKAEQAMKEALTSVDVPGIVLEQAYSTCVSALQAQRHDAIDGSDFRLVIDIRQYGIQAHSMSRGGHAAHGPHRQHFPRNERRPGLAARHHHQRRRESPDVRAGGHRRQHGVRLHPFRNDAGPACRGVQEPGHGGGADRGAIAGTGPQPGTRRGSGAAYCFEALTGPPVSASSFPIHGLSG